MTRAEDSSSGGTRPRADSIYYHIAADAAALARSTNDVFTRYQGVLTAVVFSALCLEAFVNGQLGTLTAPGGKDVRRMGAERKWTALAGYFNGKFDESVPPFSDYVDLVTLRNNRLVHFKPLQEERRLGRSYDDASFLTLAGDIALAEKALSTVHRMINELHRVTNGATEIPTFLSGSRTVASVWRSAPL